MDGACRVEVPLVQTSLASHVSQHQDHPEGLLNTRWASLQSFDSLGLGWGLGICNSERCPGNTDAAGLRTGL